LVSAGDPQASRRRKLVRKTGFPPLHSVICKRHHTLFGKTAGACFVTVEQLIKFVRD
jgi:hypothetical protein